MQWVNEFAKFLKERENVLYLGPVTGTVISPPPSVKVQLGDKIMLDNDHIVAASNYNFVVGDEVILIPSTDEQTYYLIDKAVRF